MKRFTNILCVCQSTVPQVSAIARALSLAENNQAHLTVVDVVPQGILSAGGLPGAPSVDDLKSRIIANRRRDLQSAVELAGGGSDVGIEVFFGTLFLEVIRAVLQNGHDLVVKVAEDPSWTERLFGSDDMHLLRKCPCPVWMMKPGGKPEYANIVAAVDLDLPEPERTGYRQADQRSLNEQILDIAVSWSLSSLAQLHIVHAWDAPEVDFASMWTNNPETAEIRMLESERSRHQSAMNWLTQQLRERIGDASYDYLSPRIHLPKGDARIVVPEQARKIKADLVIMGTVARTGIRGLIIGNTAEAILDQLPCSVIALKPENFVSPVG